jgi:hypothetical protein
MSRLLDLSICLQTRLVLKRRMSFYMFVIHCGEFVRTCKSSSVFSVCPTSRSHAGVVCLYTYIYMFTFCHPLRQNITFLFLVARARVWQRPRRRT